MTILSVCDVTSCSGWTWLCCENQDRAALDWWDGAQQLKSFSVWMICYFVVVMSHISMTESSDWLETPYLVIKECNWKTNQCCFWLKYMKLLFTKYQTFWWWILIAAVKLQRQQETLQTLIRRRIRCVLKATQDSRFSKPEDFGKHKPRLHDTNDSIHHFIEHFASPFFYK